MLQHDHVTTKISSKGHELLKSWYNYTGNLNCLRFTKHNSFFLNLWPFLQIFRWLFLYLMTLCLRKEALWYWSAVLKETLCRFTLGQGWTKRCLPKQLVSLPILCWSLTPLSVTLEFMHAWLSMKVEFCSPAQFKPSFGHMVRHKARFYGASSLISLTLRLSSHPVFDHLQCKQ